MTEGVCGDEVRKVTEARLVGPHRLISTMALTVSDVKPHPQKDMREE